MLISALLPVLAATSVVGLSLYGDSQNAIAPEKTPVPGENPLLFCADPSDYLITIDFVDLTPNPPVPGQTLSIVANGTLRKDIVAGATVFIQVKYGLITLIKQEADLCDNLGEVDLSCPLEAGAISIVKEVDIPKQVPPGKYSVLADVKTVDKEQLTCMESTIFFTRS